ncbi:MAG: DoxX family membrane protein [Chitinophagaceae bacterium]|nr:DoxX family membrane protein [Chitinophagaceae bacterium]
MRQTIKLLGSELEFPAPLVMAFLAKGAEFLCGILLCAELFTKISSLMIAIDWLIFKNNGESI